jgi:hypothetical protein
MCRCLIHNHNNNIGMGLVQPDNFSPEDLVELTPLDRTLGWFE